MNFQSKKIAHAAVNISKIASSIAKAFILSLLIIGQVNLAHAQSTSTASILPPAKTTFVDQNGKPLTGGSVGFFIPGTMTQKTTWQDAAETIPNSNPVILDSAGRALILGSGSYRQIVKDRFNNQIWDQVTATAGSGSTGPTATGDGDLVGTIKPWAGMTAPNQYMLAAGAQISRALFPALFTTITSVQTVTCTAGNTTINGLTDTTNFWVGMTVEVPCLAAGQSTIVSKTSTSVTLAAAPNASTNVAATFFPWGNGNGTTTFTIPDLRGLVIAGNNNMGGTASSNLISTFFGATSNSIGALGGSQSSSTTLLAANLPPYTPSGTNSAPTISAGGGSPLGVASGTGQQVAQSGTGSSPFFAAGSFVTLSAAAPTFTGTPAAGQISTPIVKSIVQPTETANYIIKVTPDQNSATASGVTSLGLMTGDIACGTNITCTGNVISVPSIVSPCLLNVPIVGTGITTVPGCDARGALGTAAFVNIGTSGATVGLLNTANAWSGIQTFNSGMLALTGSFTGAIVSAPSTPSAGSVLGWFDGSDLRLHDINSSGAIGTTVVSKSCVSGGQFVQTVAANGTITCNTPAGGGNVSVSTTPTAGQNAYWTGATSIQGLTPASVQTGSLSPTGTGSTTGLMMGLGLTGCSITPTATGRVHFEISGTSSNTNTATTTSNLRTGTGTAPSNAGPPAGSQLGAIYRATTSAAAAGVPITMAGIVTGLTLGTAVWFDADVLVGAGTGSLVVGCNAFEF